MDPNENPLWFAQQLVETLQREVAQKEAELSMLKAHEAKLLQAFSMPTFPAGYTPSGAIHAEQRNSDQDRSRTRNSSTPDVADPSGRPAKRKRSRVPAVVVKEDSPSPRSPPPAHHDSFYQKIDSELETPTPDVARPSGRPAKRRRIRVPTVVVKKDSPPPRSPPPVDDDSPSPKIESELETSDDSRSTKTTPHTASKGQDRNQSKNVENVTRAAPLKNVTFQGSGSGESSESSAGEEQPSPVTDGIKNQPKFPTVNWTGQIRERTTATVSGDSSSDTDDSISGEAPADKGLSNSAAEPKDSGKKNVTPAAGPAKAPSQAPSLSADAPSEDLFDWEVLGLSGPWAPERSSSLLSESSWSQQQKPARLLPCKFESIEEYRSSFEGLILEECKAHLNSSWEMQKTPVVGTTENSSDIRGVPEDRQQAVLWQFRLMYPSAGDPFQYVEAELMEGPAVRLDPSEVVLLTHKDTKLLAVVQLTNFKTVLLRTRVKLPASVGQCTVLRMDNLVTLKRQFVSLCKASDIWNPLQKQLLDPLQNNNFAISPPSDSRLEEVVDVASFHEPLLTWKRKSKFNNKQLVAMEALLQLQQGFLLVQGPPGTGKTSTIVGMVSALQIEEPGARILVCASSNAAIDEIVSRLMHHILDKEGNSYVPQRGALVRLGVEKSIHAACLPVLLDNILQGNAMASYSSNARKEILTGASIVCCTISGSGHQVFDEINRKFDILIIDEAAQALECEVLIALQRVTGRCVMVGDPCQLPSVVIQRPGAVYGRSLFERMQEAGRSIFLMTTQYRMHPHISQFPSARFYGGRLKDSPESQSMLPVFMENAREMGIDICGYNFKLAAYCFLDVTWGVEQGEVIGHSISNTEEADVVASVVQGVVRSLRRGIEPNIGVITPYLAQRSVIMKNLGEHGVDENACEVNTVDGFQGREKDVIILSCVRAQTEYGLGFVSDARRMNVALTRARHSLIIIGHAGTLRRQSTAWKALIEDASARGSYQVLSRNPKRTKMEARWKDGHDQRANAASRQQRATATVTETGHRPNQTRSEQGIKRPTGTGQQPNLTRFEQENNAVNGSGQRPNQAQVEHRSRSTTPTATGQHIRFDEDSPEATGTRQLWTHASLEQPLSVICRNAIGNSNQRSGDDSREQAGLKTCAKRKAGHDVSGRDQGGGLDGQHRKKIKEEGDIKAEKSAPAMRNIKVKVEEEDQRRRENESPAMPSVGRMRGQVDRVEGSGWYQFPTRETNIVKEGVTRQHSHPFLHGQDGQVYEYPADAGPPPDRHDNSVMEFGDARNGATSKNRRGRGFIKGRGRGSSSSDRSNHRKHQVDSFQRQRNPPMERREDNKQVNRHRNNADRQSWNGKKRRDRHSPLGMINNSKGLLPTPGHTG